MFLPGNGKPNEKRCVKKAVYPKFDAEILKAIRLRGVTLDIWNDHVIGSLVIGGLMDLWTRYLGVVRKLLQYHTFLNLRLLVW